MDVTRTWPDGVRIEVVERTAVAVVELAGRIRGLDADGVVFRDYKAAPRGMPRIRPGGAAGIDALKEAATVVSALPQDLVGRIDHVEVATVDQITLVLRDQRQVLWGSAEESELKAQVIERLLAEEGTVYDVSVPGEPDRPLSRGTARKSSRNAGAVWRVATASRGALPMVFRNARLT